MSLKQNVVDLVTQSTLKAFGKLEGLSMLELGNQIGMGTTGKEYWTSKGMNHTSVDLNGRTGSIVKDLSKLEDFNDMLESFDVVYNSGTSEHVEPFQAQYTCFKIMDAVTRKNGVIINLVPDVLRRDIGGHLKDHCRYYYSVDFFDTLIQESKYEKIVVELDTRIVKASYIKTNSSKFMEDQTLFNSKIAIRNLEKDFSKNDDYIFQNK